MTNAGAIRVRRLALVVGFGMVIAALAGAVRPLELQAQVIPPPDTIPVRDSLRRLDSLRTTRDTVAIAIPPRADPLGTDSSGRADIRLRDSVAALADSIKPALATAPSPTQHEIGSALVWDRDALFASGAHTLLDLLDQVPGVSGLRVGWLLPPETATYNGAFGRIRVFLDGVELLANNPRTGGLYDLSSIDLWPLERVQVERGAGELRVRLRSWRVQRTTPDTRTDVATGQYRTNIFRGYFGRRLAHGESIQFGFQQFSTGDPQRGGDGDQLSLMGRLGWTTGNWSFDAYGTRRRRSVTQLKRRDQLTPLPAMDGVQQFGYLRAGYRQPDSVGIWFQAIASNDAFVETTEFSPATPNIPADSADTTRSRAQYVVSGGWNRGPFRLTAIGRYSSLDGEGYFSPVLRGELDSRWASISARAERRAEDSTTRAEVVVDTRPLPWLSAIGSVGHMRSDNSDAGGGVTAARGEIGVRVGRIWLTGGALRGGDVSTGAPIVLDRTFQPAFTADAIAVYGGLRGPVWRDVSADVLVTTWTGGGRGIYRPQHQAHGNLLLDTRWLSRFPSGQFGLRASAGVAYRSDAFFPIGPEVSLQTVGSTVVSMRLEITIQQVAAFIESRNTMAAEYELAPGYVMPRNVLLYGVRWQFWN